MVFVRGSYSVTPEEEFPVHPYILRIRAYQRKIYELDTPPQPATHVETVAEVPALKPRKVTELQRAKTFLAEALSGEPMLATAIEKLAIKAGISKRTLRRAAKALKVKSRRKGNRGPRSWSMIRAEQADGQGAKVAG
jgi:hypothetical protein